MKSDALHRRSGSAGVNKLWLSRQGAGDTLLIEPEVHGLALWAVNSPSSVPSLETWSSDAGRRSTTVFALVVHSPFVILQVLNK